MGLDQLLEKMSHDIGSLDFGQKMQGGLVVVLLSIVIVFAVLVLLMYIIKGMGGLSGAAAAPAVSVPVFSVAPDTDAPEAAPVRDNDEDEVAAVIAAVIAAADSSGASNLVVRSITRSPEAGSAWNRSNFDSNI